MAQNEIQVVEEVFCLAAEVAQGGLEACEEQYMKSQRSWVSRDSCSAMGMPCVGNIENRLESSKMPRWAQASQEATARRNEAVAAKSHVVLLSRHEQRDLQGPRPLVRLEHRLFGIVLQGR